MKLLKNLSTFVIATALVGMAGCSESTNKAPVSAEQQAVKNMPNPTPIVFARGGTEAVVSGTLSGFDVENFYSIKVNAGQAVQVMQVGGDETRITLSLYDPSGENVTDMDLGCNGNKTISPTVAGTYTIKVFECMKGDEWNGPYTIKVSVK